MNEEELLVGLDGEEEAPRRMKQEPCMNNLQVIMIMIVLVMMIIMMMMMMMMRRRRIRARA